MSTGMQMSPRELSQELGGYREAWADLGAVLEEYGGLGFVPDADVGAAHIYSPVALDRLGRLVQSPHLGRHHNDRHFASIHAMLAHLYKVMRHNADLKREKALWREKSNVVESVQWVNLAANTQSSIATVVAPYSGVNFMILDVLIPAELTPLAWLTNFTFAGINFATPSTGPTYSTAAGVLGTPGTQGMGLSSFYQNKTAPDGSRGWSPWTGWILSSDARIQVGWFNPDTANARSLNIDFLMRSSPCGAVFQQQGAPVAWHASQGYQHAIDSIYGAVLGLSGYSQGAPQPMQSSHLATGHYGPAGIPVGGPGQRPLY